MNKKEVVEAVPVPEPEETGLVSVAGDGGFPMLIAQLGEGTLEKAKKLADVYDKLKEYTIGQTKVSQWKRFGEKPYLEAEGCLLFAQNFGVSFLKPSYDVLKDEDELGPIRIYTCEVTAQFMGRLVTERGIASTADQFFNSRRGGKLVRRPLSEIRLANVMLKAQTNAKSRATRQVLALTFTWEEIYAGLRKAGKNPDAIGQISFKGKGGGSAPPRKAQEAPRSAPEKTSPPPASKEAPAKQKPAAAYRGGPTTTDDKRAFIWDILVQSAGSAASARMKLEDMTTFEGREGTVRGKSDVSELSDKQVNWLYEKACKLQETLHKGGGTDGEGTLPL